MPRKPKKPNMTVTSRFFEEKSRAAARQIKNPFPNPPPGRGPIGRLHARFSSAKAESTTSELVDLIGASQEDAIFCLDTGVFTRDLDVAVWNALRTRHILISPNVCRELLPWLKTPFCNMGIRDSVVAALKNQSGTVGQRAAPPNIELACVNEEFINHAYLYYVRLLTLRKMMGPLVTAVLTEKLGRAPMQAEFCAEVQRQFGERGFLLAKKGLDVANSPNKLTDEHLVVTAVMTAIMRGSEVIIVTRDTDVFEQYVKLLCLMKENYRAMLAAERYALKPAALAFRQVPVRNDGPYVHVFSGSSVLEFETTDAEFNPLPPKCHFVNIYCLLLGGEPTSMKVTFSTFCAETEMARALRVKASTNGLNTDKFNGCNCIIHTEHLTPDRQRVTVLIGKERTVRFGDFTVGIDDANNTLTVNELTTKFHYDGVA